MTDEEIEMTRKALLDSLKEIDTSVFPGRSLIVKPSEAFKRALAKELQRISDMRYERYDASVYVKARATNRNKKKVNK